MASPSEQPSPQLYARIGGWAYLLLIAAGVSAALFVRGPIIVSGDALATARNMTMSQSWWRAGIAADVVMHLLDCPVMLAFYLLLRPVDRNLALLSLLFNLVQTAVLVANKLTLVIPLLLLGNAHYLEAFDPAQLQAASYICLRIHDQGFAFGLLFFGCVCLIEGHLIRQSGFLPGVLGLLLQIAGICYLSNSFAVILFPALASKLFPAVMLPPFVAELSLALWLVVKGVDGARWQARFELSR